MAHTRLISLSQNEWTRVNPSPRSDSGTRPSSSVCLLARSHEIPFRKPAPAVYTVGGGAVGGRMVGGGGRGGGGERGGNGHQNCVHQPRVDVLHCGGDIQIIPDLGNNKRHGCSCTITTHTGHVTSAGRARFNEYTNNSSAYSCITNRSDRFRKWSTFAVACR